MKGIFCDKCKKNIPENHDTTDEGKRVRPVAFDYEGRRIDLCYTCKKLFEDFLDQKPI